VGNNYYQKNFGIEFLLALAHLQLNAMGMET